MASLGEMCEHGQTYELLELIEKRKKGMSLSDARVCMKPISYCYVAEDVGESGMHAKPHKHKNPHVPIKHLKPIALTHFLKGPTMIAFFHP